MQKRVVAQTNHQTTKIAAENKWHGDLFTNGENLTAKTPSGDFQVTTPETPLLSQQAVISKGISSTLPTYSWTFTPIPNWTCSVVTVPLFNAWLPSTWLTNCTNPSTQLQSSIKKVVGSKVLHFIHTMKIKKMLGHKTQWCTYMQLLHKNDELGQNFVSSHNFLEQSLLNACATCELLDGP